MDFGGWVLDICADSSIAYPSYPPPETAVRVFVAMRARTDPRWA